VVLAPRMANVGRQLKISGCESRGPRLRSDQGIWTTVS